MALPLTNLSLSDIKNATGANDYSLINQFNYVNPWGFNSPNTADQLRYWGVILPPPPPHNIGAFRNYDHLWRCFAFDSASIPSSSNIWLAANNNIVLPIKYFPSYSTAPNVTHSFELRFKKTSDFNMGGYTVVNATYNVSDNGNITLTFDPLSMPDSTVSTGNETVYFEVVHKSSPERRWDINMNEQQPDPDIEDTALIPVAISAYPWTDSLFLYNPSAINKLTYKTSTNSGISISDIEIALNSYQGVTVDLIAEVDTESDFSSNNKQTLSTNYNYTTQRVLGNRIVTVSMSDSDIPLSWNVGTTVYYRIKINTVSNNNITFSSSWVSLGSNQITNVQT